jgi:hypothetical protein
MKLSEMDESQIKVYRTLAGPLIWKCNDGEPSMDVVKREMPEALPYQAEVIAVQLDELRSSPVHGILCFPGVTRGAAPKDDDFIDVWTVWVMEVASDQA